MAQPTILYVEDNEDLRESVVMALEGSYAVTACATGEQALALIEQGDGWDLLVTDVSLPGLSGLELARRAVQRKPEQWVVLCSGYDVRDDLVSLGSNARALVKPFALDALEDLLRDIVARASSAG